MIYTEKDRYDKDGELGEAWLLMLYSSYYGVMSGSLVAINKKPTMQCVKCPSLK